MSNNQSPPNDDISLALRREASMSAMAIGDGLTRIRKMDFSSTGYFYSGLLSLTSGLERLLKLIVIYDRRMGPSGQFPQNGELKSLGHSIKALIAEATKIEQKHGWDFVAQALSDELLPVIVENMTDFAVQSRYYNLDYLAGVVQPRSEPLKRWDEEVARVICDRHFKASEEHLAGLRRAGQRLGEVALIIKTAEDGSAIGAEDFLVRGAMIETKQKYALYYVLSLVRSLTELFAALEERGQFFPWLREFYLKFRIAERSVILRKKVWDPTRL